MIFGSMAKMPARRDEMRDLRIDEVGQVYGAGGKGRKGGSCGGGGSKSRKSNSCKSKKSKSKKSHGYC
jgi:hypothetical protein